MSLRALALPVLATACLLAVPAQAWDRTGHLVVARIAWEELSPAARSAAAELLDAAPEDADLRQLAPESRTLDDRRRQHFQLAAYWPDLMRDGTFPERRDRYHHGNWHYINYFFEQSGPERTPHLRTDLKPEETNVVERLEALVPTLGDAKLPAAQRAIHLAWVLHLTGDVHQPLHATARVTELEPRGDRGGNLFQLDGKKNLHWFWDSALRRSNSRWFLQSEDSYVTRVALGVRERHPRAELTGDLAPGDYEAWARDGFETAKASLYPAELVRFERPPRSYARAASRISDRAVALAGYRLAELLERQLGE